MDPGSSALSSIPVYLAYRFASCRARHREECEAAPSPGLKRMWIERARGIEFSHSALVGRARTTADHCNVLPVGLVEAMRSKHGMGG
jgi:hypothetical protein